MATFSDNLSNNIGVVQNVTDPDDIRQYQAIIDRIYKDEHGTERPHSDYKDLRRRDSYILLRDKHNDTIVGGVCLTSVREGSSGHLPFEDRESFNNWNRLLPRVSFENYSRAQISSLAVIVPDYIEAEKDKDFAAYEIKKNQYIKEQKTRLIKKAIKYAFEHEQVNACITMPKGSLDENELQDPTSNISCTEAALKSLEFGMHNSREGLATLRDVFLLSTGSDKKEMQRVMYVLSNDRSLSRLLKAENSPTPRARFDSITHTYGGPERKERMPVVWASRYYSKGERPKPEDGQEQEPLRTQPDAILFDWDMVFNNYVPRYVAAANFAMAQIKEKYGVQPIESKVAITDVNTDVPDFIDGLYIDNRAIRGRTIIVDEASGRTAIVPVKPGEIPDNNTNSDEVAQSQIANEAYKLMMDHLEEHGLSKTGQIYRWKKTLELLKEKGIKYAIVSNGEETFIKDFIATQMSPEERALFDDVPVLGNAGKPDPKRLLEACALLEVKPSKDVWFVGDTMETDVRAAMRAGLHPILFGFRDIPEIDKLRQNKDYIANIPKTPADVPGADLTWEDRTEWQVDCVSGHTTLQWRIAPEKFKARFESEEEYYHFISWLEEFDRDDKNLDAVSWQKSLADFRKAKAQETGASRS